MDSIPDDGTVLVSFVYREDLPPMTYSVNDEVSGFSQKVENVGCEQVDDFAAFQAGNIAIIERGTRDFQIKADNALTAGTIGAVIYNDEKRADTFFGHLAATDSLTIPVFSTPRAVGEDLSGLTQIYVGQCENLGLCGIKNIILETPHGTESQVIMVGAHLDLAPQSPGINDNGSAVVANLLELAIQMAKNGFETANKIRFAFWGAHEINLDGSANYLTTMFLSTLDRTEYVTIKVSLNMEMLASQKAIRPF